MTSLSLRVQWFWRLILLKTRGKIRHHDRFGLSYWMWENTRALAFRTNQSGTDDTGVLEQIVRLFKANGKADQDSISIDVGAYFGIVSLAMAHNSPPGHIIHAFEADDINFSMLLENIPPDPAGRIHTHRTAVGAEVGYADFTRVADTGTNHLGAAPDSSDPSTSVYKVPVTTLDAFAAEHAFSTVTLLKIDAEGADFDVLLGAKELLAENRIGAIIVEVTLTPEKRSEMIKLLTDYGFSTSYIVRNSKELKPALESTFAKTGKAPLNMLAIKPEIEKLLDNQR
jgi:FkbM family methyltransferase